MTVALRVHGDRIAFVGKIDISRAQAEHGAPLSPFNCYAAGDKSRNPTRLAARNVADELAVVPHRLRVGGEHFVFKLLYGHGDAVLIFGRKLLPCALYADEIGDVAAPYVFRILCCAAARRVKHRIDEITVVGHHHAHCRVHAVGNFLPVGVVIRAPLFAQRLFRQPRLAVRRVGTRHCAVVLGGRAVAFVPLHPRQRVTARGDGLRLERFVMEACRHFRRDHAL